jgi:NAD(P)-dependent dehydrogenase (short-subunit alcohol dehydrogenase family)
MNVTEKKTAVVTGSTKGWGRAIAEGLAAAGVQVVVNGRSEDVDLVVAQIRDRGGVATGARLAADTSAGVDELVQAALGAYGGIDIWVNSLGVQKPQPLLDLDLTTWERIIAVQLTAMFLGTQRAARQMVARGQGGRILNIVGAGAYGVPNASAHAASKGAALAATVSWAEELRPHHISVVALRGGVQSPGMRAYLAGVGVLDSNTRGEDAMMRDLGFYRGEEAAPLAVWLATEPSGEVTGLQIGIDGPRIVAYGRVSVALELYEESGWSVELLEERLRPALAELSSQANFTSQRLSVNARTIRFEEPGPIE